MKVLFAVSSENISESIIKKYQKDYKEILSYKNVYYFNAILKEIQRDKTYDRIVISEDLEPFTNNNYDTIDKFIFDKLDSISDEAQDSRGKETSIILICSDRRVKGNSILVKLFGIGVYNALLAGDRNIDQVCKLINRPRTKKEAKMYYRIDTDDVNYKAENENEVSEVEIQNILAHFKKLGRNTAKYSDSFNNIAIQYTDEQLKIIVNCLPINVKAILESNCERYQQLMAVTGGIPSVKGIVNNATSVEGTIRSEISEKKIGQAGKITKPIVIPSAVRNAKNTASPVIKKAPTAVSETAEIPTVPAQRPVVRQNSNANVTSKQIVRKAETKIQTTEVVDKVATNTNLMQNSSKVRVNKKEEIEAEVLPGVEDLENEELVDIDVYNDNIVEDINLDDLSIDEVETSKEIEMPKTDEVDDLELDFEDATSKRGRGRPRKTPVSGVEVKPKGKRGRPRKIIEEPKEEIEVFEETILPGIQDEEYIEENILPGIDDEEYIEENILPGIDDENIEANILPGMDDEYSADVLPGIEETYPEETYPEESYQEEDILPGIEENEEYEEVEELEEYEEVEEFEDSQLPGVEDSLEEVLPGFEDELDEDEYTEEVSLPGLDDLEDVEEVEEEILPGFEDEFEEYEEISDEADVLPRISFEDSEEDELLPEIPTIDDEEDSEEETLLPGMGFEDEDNFDEIITQNKNSFEDYSSNSLESIKPRVDYSMSSLNSLITKDKKIITFIGTSKNGVSFLVNNLAALFSSLGINTAVLDMTQNKNSYYIYTKNEEELRNIAFNSIEKLQNGYAEGIRVDKNLTVYTALPNDGKDYSNAEPILSTLIQNHSLILIDCDYDTDLTYFASCQEMYLVQSMDILTIQPLTAFLRELKTKGILEPEKIRVVVNKELKVRSLSIKAIIGGLAYYNDPAMSFMTELFNKDIVKACTIPFEDNAYSKYLEGIVNCNISLNGYSKAFLSKLKVLGDMVYPLTSKQSYTKTSVDYNKNAFSSSMNDTLNKMRKKY